MGHFNFNILEQYYVPPIKTQDNTPYSTMKNRLDWTPGVFFKRFGKFQD